MLETGKGPLVLTSTVLWTSGRSSMILAESSHEHEEGVCNTTALILRTSFYLVF